MTKTTSAAKALAPRRKALAWTPAFLAELAASGSVRRAIRAAGVARGTPYEARERHPDFAAKWDKARAAGLARSKQCASRVFFVPALPEPAPEPAEEPADAEARPASAHWRSRFFDALAATSNVTDAAKQVHVTTATIYKLRREDPAFATKWQAALHEGYDNLEMEVLGHLRNARPGPKMDVTAALRLLAAHRDTVERRRALADEEDELATLASIDRFIDDMRERRAANDAILGETESDDGAE
jgi:hypothetical protein